MLAKDPSERPESATDVLFALDAIDLSEGPPLERGDGGISDPHALDSLAGGVFVGRQREMGDLKAALEDTLSGRGRLVMLVGEPGIGKSRTAQELATYAGLRGAQILWGRSYEEQGVPPYWPWVQAIRSYVRDRDPDQLRSEMGAGAAEIAEVVSDVRDRLPSLPPAPQLEPEQARFRLFDSITVFLKTASQRQPLVLVLDDLHWADQPTLALLQFMARELGGARLLIIGTYRDMELSRQHPLAEALGELTRERLFQRVLLRGLTQEDVGRFIDMTSGHTAPRGLVEAVHTQTEGNPLFVTEVVRLLVQEGELSAEQVRETDSWTIRIPEGVREVIGRRLNRLSQRCNEALTVASIIGREFTLAQLRPLIEEVTEERLLEVLEEALSSRVVEELPQAVGRYQFTHALIQETLAEELSLNRRVRLHARIAETLEELYGDDAVGHASELAYHFAESESVLGPVKLVRYSILAGERALAGYGYEEAQSHFQRGIDAKGSQPADEETAALYYGLGRAQAATFERHNVSEPVASLRRAFDYYVETGEVDRAVAVASYQTPSFSGVITGASELISNALALVPPDSHQAGRLLSQYGLHLGRGEGDYEGAREAFSGALGVAQREKDTALEMQTLANAAYVDFFHDRGQESLDKSRRAIELAQRVEDAEAEVNARMNASRVLQDLGELVEARVHAEAALALAERFRHRHWLTVALRNNQTVHQLVGDWIGARDFSDRGLILSPRFPPVLFNRILLEYEAGDWNLGRELLERLVEVMEASPPAPTLDIAMPALAIALVARITGKSDFLEVAATAADTVLAFDSVQPIIAIVVQASLALLAVVRGDAVAAEEQYAVLEHHRGRMWHGSFVPLDRLLGLLSQTMGNLDQAAAHFEDALTFCRKAGYRPELAWSCCDYADALRERDGDGDRAKAIALLDESLSISSELGMRPLMERVLSRREILGA